MDEGGFYLALTKPGLKGGMDFGFDHQDHFGTAPAVSEVAAREPAPSWAGLKARFQAAHAFRSEQAALSGQTAAGGSFLARGAHVLAQKRAGSPVVNPTVLGNCKARYAKDEPVAGNPQHGDRG